MFGIATLIGWENRLPIVDLFIYLILICCNSPHAVPGDYFAHLDASGRRIDIDQRPELIKGSVEFIAPAEYMVRPPMPPLYFFLIDVSISAVRSGMLEVSGS